MSEKRILVAEDHPGTRGLVVNVLTNILGHKVIVTHDGLRAFSLAAKEHPNLIITDIDLPGMDGVDLIKRLKANPSLENIPIIAMTAGGRAQEALAAGCHLVLQKPFYIESLSSAVEAII